MIAVSFGALQVPQQLRTCRAQVALVRVIYHRRVAVELALHFAAQVVDSLRKVKIDGDRFDRRGGSVLGTAASAPQLTHASINQFVTPS